MSSNCATCQLFRFEGDKTCFHVNRPGGLILTEQGLGLCHLPVGARVLDIASGASTTVQYMVEHRNLRAVGLDLSLDMLRLGKERNPELCLLQADSGQIPFADYSQEAVLIECALSLAGNISSNLKEIRRVLANYGKLIVSDLYIRDVIDPGAIACLEGTRCLSGILDEETIRGEMNKNGLKIKIWQDQTGLFKTWVARMVFALGSLDAFYRHLTGETHLSTQLSVSLGKKIKLGYYLMIAEKG